LPFSDCGKKGEAAQNPERWKGLCQDDASRRGGDPQGPRPPENQQIRVLKP
jgi:hypothetical protein